MVTPETLTDEMVRATRNRHLELGWECFAVLGRDWLFTDESDLLMCRQRICNAINARSTP